MVSRSTTFATSVPGNVNHIECLQVGAAINLTIRNSSFRNCDTHDIFIRSWGTLNNSPSPLSNIVIQNNSFAQTTSGYYTMQVMDDQWTGLPRTSVFILNNTSHAGDPCPGHERDCAGPRQLHRRMSAYFCNSYGQNKWFDYNTYGSGVACGVHDTVSGTSAASTPVIPVRRLPPYRLQRQRGRSQPSRALVSKTTEL